MTASNSQRNFAAALMVLGVFWLMYMSGTTPKQPEIFEKTLRSEGIEASVKSTDFGFFDTLVFRFDPELEKSVFSSDDYRFFSVSKNCELGIITNEFAYEGIKSGPGFVSLKIDGPYTYAGASDAEVMFACPAE
jgi:hypothetical protein